MGAEDLVARGMLESFPWSMSTLGHDLRVLVLRAQALGWVTRIDGTQIRARTDRIDGHRNPVATSFVPTYSLFRCSGNMTLYDCSPATEEVEISSEVA